MLQFRLGSIPVEVRSSHLIVAVLLAWSWMPAAQSDDSSRMVLGLLGGAFVVFVSILVHELGHALTARMFGYRPSIVIEWFGGHTSPNEPGPIPWIRDILLTLAGPLFGLGLGLVSFAALSFMGVPFAELGKLDSRAPLSVQILTFFALANLIWAVFNLVPVLPLDGGRISHVFFTRLFGRHGVLVSQGIALVLSAALTAWGAVKGQLFIAVFFGLWAINAVRALAAYFRGSELQGQSPHPADLAFAQAASLFNERRLQEAREIAERTLQENDVPPASAARLTHLLGWIAIKEGRGQEALDHFSKLDRRDLEPHALAAAYALAGDDERALPLWELAWRSSRQPAVKAEWIGTLLRLGRDIDARRLAGEDLLAAWQAAERVLFLRGEFEKAAALGQRALAEFPNAELAYNTACSLARSGRVDEALAMLERAAQLGFRDASHAERDPDLAAVRQSRGFDAWLRRIQQSAAP